MLARSIYCVLLIGVSPDIGQAQNSVPAGTATPPVVTQIAATGDSVPITLVTVPALTPLYLRIDQEISSKTAKNGDRFPIAVEEDVRIGEVLVIPAGSAGQGEVIHAARSGAGGKAGELIVTARFVRVGDREIRLRSFSLGAKGRDRANESFATSFVAGPLALFVVGGAVVIPRGTVAGAKTAMEIQLPAGATKAPVGLQPSDSTKGGNNENDTN